MSAGNVASKTFVSTLRWSASGGNGRVAGMHPEDTPVDSRGEGLHAVSLYTPMMYPLRITSCMCINVEDIHVEDIHAKYARVGDIHLDVIAVMRSSIARSSVEHARANLSNSMSSMHGAC